jgi:Cof subfamily protein (haloacid dehalogenase superfamily)
MKLLTTDLDGTLLNKNKEISQNNIKALEYAANKGIKVIVATGRIYSDVCNLFKNVKIDKYVIANNGACIYNTNGSKISAKAIEKNDLMFILKYLHEKGIYFEISTEDNLYIPFNWYELLNNDINNMENSYLKDIVSTIFSQKGIIFIKSIDDFINTDKECYSISVISLDFNKLSICRKYFEGLNKFSIQSSDKSNFEIMSINSSKGNALEILANYLNICFDDIIAIGDNFNDISMLEKAGLSIAMRNAEESVKKVCSFITNSNELDGVAEAIYKYL